MGEERAGVYRAPGRGTAWLVGVWVLLAGCGQNETNPFSGPNPPPSGEDPPSSGEDPIEFLGDRLSWHHHEAVQARVELGLPGEYLSVYAWSAFSAPPDTVGVVPILGWPEEVQDSLRVRVIFTDKSGRDEVALDQVFGVPGTPPPAASTLLRCTMVDVGWGDAHLIETPSGRRIMIDAGSGRNQWMLRAFLEARIHSPSSGGADIDHFLVSHLHADHYSGLEDTILKPGGYPGYDVGSVYFSTPYVYSDYAGTYSRLKGAARSAGATIEEPETGDFLDLAPELETLVLNAGNPFDDRDENNSSLVLRMSYGDVDFVYTGDAEERLENEIRRRFAGGLDAVVLKVGHHGRDDATGPSWVSSVAPRVALVPIDASEVEYSMPDDVVLAALIDQGAVVFRSDSILPGAAFRRDRTGHVEVRTDGTSVTVQTFSTGRSTAG